MDWTLNNIVPEINEMFAKRVPARKWSKYRCDIAQYTAESHHNSTLPGDDDDIEKKALTIGHEKIEKV
jgi:hypothetical protein